MSFIQFESAREKEKIREELRSAREELLKRAQQNAEARADREKQKKLRGDTDWVLPAISKKIDKSSKSSSKKSKKSKKKKSKDKKEKKKKKKRSRSSSSDSDSDSEEEVIKKKKRKRKYSTESSSSSDSSSEDEKRDDWVEKEVSQKPVVRDDWMTGGLLLKTYSKEEASGRKKDVEKRNIDDYDPSKFAKELNPYWKDGGSGLPTTFRKPTDDDEDIGRRSASSSQFKSKTGNWRKKSAIEDEKKQQLPESSSSSESEPETPQEQPSASTSRSTSTRAFLTDQQMNELGAKIVKAEIMGNDDLAQELKAKLEAAREARKHVDISTSKATSGAEAENEEEHVVLTTTDRKGFTRPLSHRSTEADLWGGKKGKSKKKAETHVSGERVRYFPDDDRFDIKQMFQAEKGATADDSEAQFMDIATKHKNPNDDLEDIFADKVRKNISDYDKANKEDQRAIREHEKYTSILENCRKCFDSPKMEKQLLISLGESTYMSLPSYEGLQTGHCLIQPLAHVTCSTMLDEDAWDEICDFRKGLTRMFAARKKDVIFFETARYLNKRPHMVIHCIPGDNFEMAPFYFKKAIQESEYEWSTNKQLISLKDKSVRRAIPKGLPYFWVQFGMDSGFAHVIEDQERFPSNFAEEIIGGMLNLNPKVWRKPRTEYNVIPKVKQLADWWKPFDFTSRN